MSEPHFGDALVTDEDAAMIRKVARQFGVTDNAAYYRAKSLRLLSYQVKEDAEAHYANMRKIMAYAIADGFSNGNEPYPQASDIMKHRYDMATDAVLKELSELQAASAPLSAS